MGEVQDARRHLLAEQYGPAAVWARPDLFGMPLFLGFVHHFGHVPYRNIRTGSLPWRFFSEMAACEIDSSSNQDHAVVFDHCHRHGWVRGMLCDLHNHRVGQLEAAMTLEGVKVDLGTSPYASYPAQCPECSGAQAVTAYLPSDALAIVNTLQAWLLERAADFNDHETESPLTAQMGTGYVRRVGRAD